MCKILFFLKAYENEFSAFFIFSHKKVLFFFTLKQLASTVGETLICVLGMSAILSSISNKIGDYLQDFLNIEEEDKSIGTITALLFFILAFVFVFIQQIKQRRFILMLPGKISLKLKKQKKN